MKAIVQTGPEELDVQERERPAPDPDEVLVRVHSAGLCGSDAHAFLAHEDYDWTTIPRIIGHEYSGTVTAVGADVDGFDVGQQVVEEPIHSCGACFQCENGQPNVCRNISVTGMHGDGGYCEYRTVDAEFLHHVPDSVPLREAAVTEPMSVAARAVLDQSEITPGDTVLVQGPGPIGVFSAAIADSMGARVLVSGLGTDATYRLPLVESLGIESVNAEDEDLETVTDEFTDGIGFDAVVDATGHRSGVGTAIEHVRGGGEVVVVGIPGEPSEVAFAPVVRGEIDIRASYGSTWRNFEQAIRLMEGDRVDVAAVIDTSVSTDDPEAAFRAFLDGETCKPVFSFADD